MHQPPPGPSPAKPTPRSDVVNSDYRFIIATTGHFVNVSK